MTFSICNKEYNINDLDEIIDSLELKFIKNSKKIEYLNIPFSFDIETTSTKDGDEKIAFMYAFVFGINGKCIMGRKWEEFIYILERLKDKLGLNDNKRIIIYSHNFAFEFQFIRKLLTWQKVFALDERKPVYALIDESGIEFRCSYIMSGYPLVTLGKNLQKYKVDKMVGDLDYELIRHSKTPLTEKEKGYILNDGLIVMAYIQEEIEYFGDITKLPLTKTSVVRNYVRKCCYYDGSHRKNVNKFINYRRLMKVLQITDVSEYKQLKNAFQGGFTHANMMASGTIIKGAKSFDFISSYPYVMVSEQYPMGRCEKVKLKSKEDFEFNLKYYCCLFTITFRNLESIATNEHPLSQSHCQFVGKFETDNGRIIRAEECTTTLTEQDYFIYRKFYKWDSCSIKHFKRYKKRYLPTDFIKAILKLYEDKTKLKGVKGKELEYNKAKEQINSAYGMCVTDICRDDIIYEEKNTQDVDDWSRLGVDYEKTIERYNNSVKRFLSYHWGVWVTAYARRNLFSAIVELGDDYIYSDTDSVKFINYENHKEYFEKYNRNVIKKLHRAMKYHNLDFDMVSPKTIKGETKTLGLWDFDGDYKYFKTLGAKRYMVVNQNDDISLTISGINKRNAIPFLKQQCRGNSVEETNINILKYFKDGMYVPSEYFDENTKEKKSATGKQTHTYVDEEKNGVVVDYLGNEGEYHAKSGTHLENADYTLSLSFDYLNLIMGVKEYAK